MLPRTSLMPAQRARLARLEAVLQSLEQSVPTLVAKPPLRPTGT
ncbi:hypothetical protein [Paraburkholderia fungorum]|nr:hypothetical protein [Paraburkholderia fungorum]